MSTSIPYWHIDAFADRPFTGNQAAVMLLEAWLDDATLLAIGEENNFAETAFLVPATGEDADYELRWFTPATEVRLCGHATLASGHVILSREPARNAVRFATREVGVLQVSRDGEGYALSLPAIRCEPHDWPEAVAGLGATPEEIVRNADGYTILRYADEAAVRGLDPDMRALAALGIDTFIATARGSETDVVSRVFVPGAGVDEDSVTGAAHAALTPFWAERLGRESFTAYQASARGGHLTCRIDGERSILGGSCVTVVEGTFQL